MQEQKVDYVGDMFGSYEHQIQDGVSERQLEQMDGRACAL